MMAALLLALAGCGWGQAPTSDPYPSSGDYSNNGGGPGPGDVPRNPGASGH
jgi:hypothetical protein